MEARLSHSLNDAFRELERGAHFVVFRQEEMPIPEVFGFVRSGVALPVGQVKDYRLGQPDGSCLHAQLFVCESGRAFWRVHSDRYSPSSHPILHLCVEIPDVVLASLAGGGIGWFAGSQLGRSAGWAGLASAAGLLAGYFLSASLRKQKIAEEMLLLNLRDAW